MYKKECSPPKSSTTGGGGKGRGLSEDDSRKGRVCAVRAPLLRAPLLFDQVPTYNLFPLISHSLHYSPNTYQHQLNASYTAHISLSRKH